MIDDKRSARIRQTPKYMEKMLLVNHKEEQGLQRRLEDISTNSRIKGRQLDMERIKVRNEWRFYSRLNYPSVGPLIARIPTMIQKGNQKTREPSDLVNDYLLREYRRNSLVIPSILSTVGKEMENHHNKVKENETKEALRKEKLLSSTSTSSFNSLNRRNLDQHQTAIGNNVQINSQNPSQDEEKDSETLEASRITGLVRDIAKIRNDMSANKKIDLMRSRVSFSDLLRNLQEKEKNDSDSQTYTDGTCVLLRRKMQRMRKQNEPEPEEEIYAIMGQSSSPTGNGGMRKRHSVSQSLPNNPSVRLPTLSSKKGPTSVSAIARLDILENDERELKRQLVDQERQQTELKVAIETQKYQRIQARVGEFLNKNKVKTKTTVPVVIELESSTA